MTLIEELELELEETVEEYKEASRLSTQFNSRLNSIGAHKVRVEDCLKELRDGVGHYRTAENLGDDDLLSEEGDELQRCCEEAEDLLPDDEMPALPENFVGPQERPVASKTPLKENIRWDLTATDLDHPDFGFELAWERSNWDELMSRMKDFESWTYNQLVTDDRHDSSGIIKVHKLGNDAQERLDELDLEDLDVLLKFEITSACRLWGYTRGNGVCVVLWYDPLHKVYPLPGY